MVIPTFERLPMLLEALESVHAQSFDGSAEILVVNDSPREKLASQILREFPRVNVVAEGTRAGATGARNRALSVARGNSIAFLDDDDLWEPDYLKIQMAALKGRDRAFAVSGLVICNVKDGTRKLATQRPNLKRYRSVAHHLIVTNFIRCPSTVVVPRQVIEEAGLFHEERPYGEDYDFYLRCLIAGFDPVFTKAPAVIRRQHGNQMTNPSNLEKRNAARMDRVRRYYAPIRERFEIAPQQEVSAEVHAKFAARYFRHKRYWQSAVSFLVSLAHLKPTYTFRRFSQSWKEETA
ncbi:MAG: glycosyltransferase family 2 protein [Candidatus Omnitrophota bacterium]